MTLLEIGADQDQATVIVREARRSAVADIEARLYDLEGKLAAILSGPILIPAPASPMRDHWDEIRHTLGRYAGNFTVDGERIFASRNAGNIDGLDAFLERYSPGEVNVNDACSSFCADLRAIAELRDQRGAIMRDGAPDPHVLANDPYELAALTGPFADAVIAVRELDEDMILAAHWAELDELAALISAGAFDDVDTLDVHPDRSDNHDIEPVGIAEIADRLNVKRATVDMWLQRKLLPAPRWTVGRRPCWEWADVEDWARATGRLKDDETV